MTIVSSLGSILDLQVHQRGASLFTSSQSYLMITWESMTFIIAAP